MDSFKIPKDVIGQIALRVSEMFPPFWTSNYVPEDVIGEIILRVPKIEWTNIVSVDKTFRKCCLKLLQEVDTEEKFEKAYESGDILSLSRNKIYRYANWNQVLKIACKRTYLSIAKMALSKGVSYCYDGLNAIFKKDLKCENIGRLHRQKIKQLIIEKYRSGEIEDSDAEQIINNESQVFNIKNIEFIAACRNGYTEVVERSGVKDNYVLYYGFLTACKRGHSKIVSSLADKVEEHYLDYGLVKAISKNCIEVIKILLQKGDRNLNRGLNEAIRCGHTHLVSSMVKLENIDLELSLPNACESGNMNIVRIVLGNMNKKMGWRNWNSILHHACISGNLDLVQTLAGMLTSCKGIKWDYALDGAASSGNISVVKFILDKGCHNLNDALSSACEKNHLNIIKFLLELSKNNSNYICDLNCGLQGACMGGRGEIIELMIREGADDLSLKSLCFFGRNLEIIKLMIECGANDYSDALEQCFMTNDYITGKFLVDKIDVNDLLHILDRSERYVRNPHETSLGKYILKRVSERTKYDASDI